MTDEAAQALSNRLSLLERSIRRWRWLAGAALLGLGSIALLGAYAAGKLEAEIAAKSFVVKDQNGKVHARLGGIEGPSRGAAPIAQPGIDLASQGLWLYDNNGRPRLALRIEGNSPLAVFYDENLRKRITMGVFQGLPSVTLWNQEGKPVWTAPVAETSSKLPLK